MRHALSAKGPALLPQPASRSRTRFVSLTAGLCLAALVLTLALDQPVAPLALTAALTAYTALLLRWPMLWLWVLPTVLTGIDLAPWTGRLLLDEFDLFVLATAASGLVAGRYGRGSWISDPIARALVAFWLVTVLIALGRGLLPWLPLDATARANTYLTSYNALRVGKGPLSALLLLPLWIRLRRERGQAASIQLIAGISLGLLVCGFYILWDRGVIAALIAFDRWALIQSLLDFTSTYRATGNMSQMHTGGSAIDGYLTMAFALSAAGLLKRRICAHTAISGLATLIGAYAITVTFTRATYAAGAVSFLILVAFALRPASPSPSSKVSRWSLVLAVIMYVAFLALVRTRGGLGGTVGIAAACLGGAVVTAFRARLSTRSFYSLLASAGVLGAAISYDAMLTSRWMQTISATALGLAGTSAIAATASGTLAWSRTASAPVGSRILLLTLLSVLIPLGIFATWGYRMQDRFATTGKDIETRADHWRHCLALLDARWQDWLLGLGMGRFPREYILSTAPDSRVGTYLYEQDSDNTFLRLGGGNDLNLGQRIEIPPDERGPLLFRGFVRSSGGIKKFGGSICRRRLLEQQAYNPTCDYFSIRIRRPVRTWQSFSHKIQLNKGFTDSGWTDPRFTLLRLSNATQGTLLDLDNLTLQRVTGRNYLRNGDFSAGGDRWFSYNDFEHLPWHAKNVSLAILVEQGLLSLTSFLALNGIALKRAWRPAQAGDPLAIGSIAMIAGWLTLGGVATLVDVPRNTFLFFLVLLAVGSASPCRSLPIRRTARFRKEPNTYLASPCTTVRDRPTTARRQSRPTTALFEPQ